MRDRSEYKLQETSANARHYPVYSEIRKAGEEQDVCQWHD
jgi:hypothetical protein